MSQTDYPLLCPLACPLLCPLSCPLLCPLAYLGSALSPDGPFSSALLWCLPSSGRHEGTFVLFRGRELWSESSGCPHLDSENLSSSFGCGSSADGGEYTHHSSDVSECEYLFPVLRPRHPNAPCWLLVCLCLSILNVFIVFLLFFSIFLSL